MFNASDKDLMNVNSPNHVGLKVGKVISIIDDKIKIKLNDNYTINQNDAIRFLNSNKGFIINYLYDSKGKLVSSCVCVIIPNLTRNIRPYAFIENVVTHSDYRGKGYATECLNYAKESAENENCYKMMLLTGSKKERTLNFYGNAGYNSTDKTAFIQWI